jgi:acyl-CoA dehydrogenase
MTALSPSRTENLCDIRDGIRRVCDDFSGAYWRGLEPDGYPTAFVQAVTDAGWLAALIPESYGGAGLSLSAASVILEEISASGGNAAACHAQMLVMGTVLRHGSDAQKERWLPQIASGQLRLQAFAVTEPEAGSDTTQTSTRARRDGDGWVVDGHKIWTCRAEHTDLLVLLARTSPAGEGRNRSAGLSVFLVDMRERGEEMTINPIPAMLNHSATEVFFNGLRLPTDALIGEEGQAMRYILDGLNTERALIAGECIGDGRWFLSKACAYATERQVFGRPIGANQGIQFPIAKAHMAIEAADLMRWRAIELIECGQPCGAEANMAKYLSAEASWMAANACVDTHGGLSFAQEYDIERKFREARLYKVAPISDNLVLAFVGQNVLGMPRSY